MLGVVALFLLLSPTLASSSHDSSHHQFTSRAEAAFDPNTLQVTTAQGTVRGSFTNGGKVRQWYGVPYGATTSGSNRFQPPQRAPTYKGVRDATKLPTSCAQRRDNLAKSFNTLVGAETDYPTGEDCLNVNIWAPTGSRAKGKAAVMVWLYGGAFQIGSATLSAYRGDQWVAAQDDIIIVTVNYRVGVFGFPLAPHLEGKAMNLGLLDMKAAFDWVYDNIGVFGGDPNRIIGFGQSAGGIAMDALLFAYPNLRVKGAISQSGHASGVSNAAFQYPPLSASVSASSSSWNRLAASFGCGNRGTATQLKCMQAVPLAQITTAIQNSTYTFKPVPDKITFFSDYPARLSAGKFARVPYIATHNADEGTISAAQGNKGVYHPNDFSGTSKQAPILFCGGGQATAGRVKNGVKTWQLRYHGDFAGISPQRGSGAYHAAEISMIFGTFRRILFPQPQPTPSDQIAASKFLQGVWSTFARDPQNGLEKAVKTYGLVSNNKTASNIYEIALENEADAVANPFTVQSGRDDILAGCKALGIPGF